MDLEFNDDDLVDLSDLSDSGHPQPQPLPARSSRRTPTAKQQHSSNSNNRSATTTNTSSDGLTSQLEPLEGPHDVVDNNNQEEEDDEDDDLEEIEYGYDNDLLLIVPSMLWNYSHHATNYHPERWRPLVPVRGRGKGRGGRESEDGNEDDDETGSGAATAREHITSSTCGICFDKFATFELDAKDSEGASSSSKGKHPKDKRGFVKLSSAAELQAQERILSRLLEEQQQQQQEYEQQPQQSSRQPQQQQQHALTPLHQGELSPTFSDESLSTSLSSSFSASSQSLPTTAPSINQHQQQKRKSTIIPPHSPSVLSKEIGVVMSCRHGLCLSCLQTYLTHATTNPQARFPTVCPQPDCKNPIPADYAPYVLDPVTCEVWYRKLAEVHVANKVYCPTPDCRSIVDLDDRDGTAVTCPECQTCFCASCAVLYHRGMSCEEYQLREEEGLLGSLSLADSNSNNGSGEGSSISTTTSNQQQQQQQQTRETMRLIKTQQWRKCPSCRFVIEKQQGCNHMICYCGQSFCYSCEGAWDEIRAKCSRDCNNTGGPQDDMELSCSIM